MGAISSEEGFILAHQSKRYFDQKMVIDFIQELK